MTDVLAAVAGSFGVAMGASPLLQALRAHRRRSAEDVSVPFLIILASGAVAWLAYGISIGNLALTVANGVGVAGSSTALAVTMYWRRAERTTGRHDGG
jgi:uncharacterized protein with PQ loop repeat